MDGHMKYINTDIPEYHLLAQKHICKLLLIIITYFMVYPDFENYKSAQICYEQLCSDPPKSSKWQSDLLKYVTFL